MYSWDECPGGWALLDHNGNDVGFALTNGLSCDPRYNVSALIFGAKRSLGTASSLAEAKRIILTARS